ncbi:hypothetical protein KIW84_057875 [Lathyrus oleraceus]|uniref:Uncharacterized protein n=1 Tax=Pisum sativum TaxID=3888 RepID=A0A9D4X4I4_PEA|nr:hypothetical protein KIW84_057875 [Pisum sativum]
MKIDSAKACEKMSWSFVKKVLLEISLPDNEVDKGYWDGIKTGRNGPIVSHLMFTDDLLIFGKAKEKKIRKVHKVLDKFCGISGIVL